MEEDIDKFVEEVGKILDLVYKDDVPSEHPRHVKNIMHRLHFLLSRADDQTADCAGLATAIGNKIASMS